MKTKWHDSNKIRTEILDAAGAFLRKRGASGPVDEIMRAAGLTSGALYRHFKSKEELCIESICRVIDSMVDRYRTIVAEREGRALRYIVSSYLSANHVEDKQGGCALAALGADMARGSSKAKRAYELRIHSLLGVLADGFETGAPSERRVRAQRLLSSMVGALTLARAMSDTDNANALLDAVRESLMRDL
jgi:TetR/AcrR family transcriptional regulator, transcriptional repressor for nem operon